MARGFTAGHLISVKKGIFKDKTKYPTLTRMSYCQCRLQLVFSSIFKEFGWSHVALILDRSDLFSWTVGKNLEYGLRKQGLLKFVRELDGNSEDEPYHFYLRDASMYARGKGYLELRNEIGRGNTTKMKSDEIAVEASFLSYQRVSILRRLKRGHPANRGAQ